MNIETVGDLVQYLQRFNPKIRILKSQLFANCYSQIVITNTEVFKVTAPPTIDLDGEESLTNVFVDVDTEGNHGPINVFEAVVL